MLSSCSLRFVRSGLEEEDELMKEAAKVSRVGLGKGYPDQALYL